MKAVPVPLAAHGTTYRAAICEDSCPECAPVRKRLGRKDTWRKRVAEASREGHEEQRVLEARGDAVWQRPENVAQYHGFGSYNAGCRCGLCKTYVRKYWRNYDAKRRGARPT